MFTINILISLITIWFFMYLNQKYLIPLKFDIFRFKLFALRDELAILAMKRKILPTSTEYITLNKLINSSICSLSNFKLSIFLKILHQISKSGRIKKETELILNGITKYDNKEFQNIVHRYFEIILDFIHKQTHIVRYVTFPLLTSFACMRRISSN